MYDSNRAEQSQTHQKPSETPETPSAIPNTLETHHGSTSCRRYDPALSGQILGAVRPAMLSALYGAPDPIHGGGSPTGMPANAMAGYAGTAAAATRRYRVPKS